MKASATCLVLFFTAIVLAAAQVPQVINYQGRISVGGTNFTGNGQFKFALVDGSGTVLWSNSPVGGGQPDASVVLPVANGIYSVFLGDTLMTNMAAIPAEVFGGADVRLRVWFNNGVLGFQQLTPDQRVGAVGYAIMAGNVPDGVITSSKLAAGAVTNMAIANGAIGTAQLGAGAVMGANIASGAVGSTQLAPNAVTSANIAPNTRLENLQLTGNVTLPDSPLYLFVTHLRSSTQARLMTGISTDGKNISPIGNPMPYTAPVDEGGDHPRDPVVYYRKSSGKYYAFYTHTTTNPPPNNYSQSIGVCATRDLAKWEWVAEIPINGTGLSDPWYTWMGSIFEDTNGQIYLTVSTVENDDATTLKLWWLKFNDFDDDLTDVTPATNIVSTNSSVSDASLLKMNDISVVKKGSVYHYFFDADKGPSSHDLYRCISSGATPFTGMSTPAAVGLDDIAGGTIEGSFHTYAPNGDDRIYFQTPIFGRLCYVDSADNFATFSDPHTEVSWPGRLSLGNGSVLRLDDLNARSKALAAPSPFLTQEDNSLTQYALRVPGDVFRMYFKADLNGNGLSGSDVHGLSAIAGSSTVDWNFVGQVTGAQLNATGGVANIYSPAYSRLEIQTPSALWHAIIIGSDLVFRVNTGSGFANILTLYSNGKVGISSATPASASDTGTAGQICWDANYLYICTAPNTWKRIELSAW